MKRKAKVVVEVTAFDLRLMRESLLALRNRLIAEGRHTAPVDEMLERLFTSWHVICKRRFEKVDERL